MRAAVDVGRVGGLAVALGVGLAVVTGTGVAAADTTDTESDTSTRTSDYSAKKKRTEARTSSASSTTPTPSGGGARRESEGTSDKTRDEAPRDNGSEDNASEDDASDDDVSDDASVDDTTGDDAGGDEAPGGATHQKAPEADTSDGTSDPAADKGRTSTDTRSHRTPAITDPEPAAERDEPVREVESEPTTVAAPPVRTAYTKAVGSTAVVEPVRTITLKTASAPTLSEPPVLSGVTLDPSAPVQPTAPQQSSLLLTLLTLGARRDTQARTLNTATPMAAAAVTVPVTTRVGWLTGAGSINDTVKRFGIAGTDVGVMWDNGILKDNPATTIVEQRQVLIAFGDTFSGAGMSGVWRNNVLLRSADNVLSNGLYVPNGIIHDPGAYSGSPMTNPNFSREIIGKYGYAVGSEVTIIPTAAISVPGAGANGATRQYVNFMSVRSWDTPGRWTTNYSGIIWSDDNGQNWTVVPASSIRAAAAGRSTKPFINGNQNFQQGAYVKPPSDSADAAAGWVYSYGTPAGRGGTIYLSRVNDKQILDQTKYEYWNGTGWVKNNPAAAKPILPGTTTTSFFGLIKNTTYPTAGEMSVQYNPYLKKYVMLYTDSGNNVVMRTSSTPQGTWSAPKTLVTSSQYPGLYAPMIHPWSGSTLLKKEDGTAEDPQMLYWNLSQWNEYNVALMRTDLSRV